MKEIYFLILTTALCLAFQPSKAGNKSAYGNSAIVSAYTQMSHGRYCAQVSQAELRAAGFSCPASKQPHPFAVIPEAWSIFEWNVFQLGAEEQINKNNCLSEQVKEIEQDPAQLSSWQQTLAAAWMGKRKAELILKKCKSEVYARVGAADVRKHGIKKAYEKSFQKKFISSGSSEKLPQAWQDICFDQKTLDSLEASTVLFEQTLPVLSGPGFFETMEKYRSVIQNRKTGKPITDNELLEANLQNLEFIKFAPSNEFIQETIGQISALKSDRNAMTKKLRKSHSKEGYELSAEMKEALFEDGTVHQVLMSKNLINSQYKGLAVAGSEKVSDGAFCMFAKFEPSMAGEFFEIGVLTLTGGGIFFKALQGTKYLQGLSKAAQIKKAAGLGFAAVGYPIMFKEVAQACSVPGLSKQPEVANVISDREPRQKAIAVHASSLPKELGFSLSNLEIDPNVAPSCKTEDGKNFVAEALKEKRCILTSLLNFAPLKVSLPLMLAL